MSDGSGLFPPPGAGADALGGWRSYRRRWLFESELARGGMGTIYCVFDRLMERRCAMKVLSERAAGLDEARELFLQEARITARLQHPGIPPVYDVGERPGDRLPFFTMKRVQGRTLNELIYQPEGAIQGVRGPEDLYPLLDVFVRVCEALAYAHDCGVLHCDVKPENIMVGDFGQVYLMDWGIAQVFDPNAWSVAPEARDRAFDELTLTGAFDLVAGTPGYLAPEQARGAPATTRSDIYALGICLYEILTQEHPFDAGDGIDSMATLERVRTGEFRPPSAVDRFLWLPSALEAIVMRAMARDPERRYASVIEMRDDVRRFQHGAVDFPVVEYAPGQVIVREGEEGDAAYVIEHGAVSVHASAGGARVTLNRLEAGEVFGELALLSEGKRTATVTALEPTACYVVDRSVLVGEVESLKPWMGALFKTLSSRYRRRLEHRLSQLQTNPLLQIAKQAFMIMATFGSETAAGGLRASWVEVRDELCRVFEVPTTEALALMRPSEHFRVDVEADVIECAQPEVLRDRLKRVFKELAPLGPPAA
jgi:CRP-like cAMP-binding protein/tRNA A-37 threonylcarbamoyl transferase component Bud32